MFGLVFTAFAANVSTVQSPPSDADESCRVTELDRQEARGLPWQEFDQTGDQPGSFRHLANSGCPHTALIAYDDWLANGPGFPDQRARAIGTFHRAQLLAMTGRVIEARALLPFAFRTKSDADPRAEAWNNYVRGVIAYFEHDRSGLMAMRDALGLEADDPFARRQTGVLQGLLDCFDGDYQQAMSGACRSGE